MARSKRILIAPLNWGLGHATRCIPIIRELSGQNGEVIIASDGRALELLKKEFPGLKHFELPPYNIKYPTRNMAWNMARQMPKIAGAIRREHKFVQTLINDLSVAAIISDNRFGCFSSRIKSVFLTHQLNIKAPFFKNIINFWNRKAIGKFDECWVPDFAEAPNLSGELSHGNGLKNVQFVGPLSRMKKYNLPQRYDLVAVLSGPEPQRTFLEKAILEQTENLSRKTLVIQGKPEKRGRKKFGENIEMVSFLPSEKLNEAMLAGKIIVCRSGYSSVMDLAKLGKKAILIPTPGQTEQKYLADRFFKKGIFYCQKQRELNLKEAMEKAENFTGFEPVFDNEEILKKTIKRFLVSI